MGVQKHLTDSSLVNTRKRQHSEVSGAALDESQSSVDMLESQRQSLDGPPRSHARYSPAASSRSLMQQEEDDLLLARVRALRDNLKNDTSFLQNENARVEKLNKSTSSQGTYESPTLERARLEARWRASQASVSIGTSPSAHVPAYRLRESKFVPRKNYGQIIERTKQPPRSASPTAGIDAPKALDFAQKEPPAVPGVPSSTEAAHAEPPTKPAASFSGFAPPGTHVEASSAVIAPFAPSQWSTATPSQCPTSAVNKSGFSPSNAPSPAFGDIKFATNGMKPAAAPAFGSQGTFGFGSSLNNNASPFDSSTQASSRFLNPPPNPAQTSSFQHTFGSQGSTHDHPIARHKIPSSLSASFGQPGMPPFQQNSYMSTQPNFTFDDGDDTNARAPATFGKPMAGNGLSADFIDDEAEEEEDVEASMSGFGHANPYAVLGNGDFDEEDEEAEEYDEEDGEHWAEGQYAQPRFANQPTHYPGSYQTGSHDEFEDDGDIEDEDGEGYDEDEDELEDGDTEEATEYDYDDRFNAPRQPFTAVPSCTNATLAARGQTVVEAIELSD